MKARDGSGRQMDENRGYTSGEERVLTDAVRRGELPVCPTCATPMDARAVPPRADVSYVRDRTLLVCPGCRRSHVLDRR